ncbi:MAG TPA: hypothetical protein VGN06_02805, partial [Gaiellaceae bacterium]
MIAATWSGTYALPRTASPVAIVMQMHGREATVSLGPGHERAAAVAIIVNGSRVHFRLLGLPQDVVF